MENVSLFDHFASFYELKFNKGHYKILDPDYFKVGSGVNVSYHYFDTS